MSKFTEGPGFKVQVSEELMKLMVDEAHMERIKNRPSMEYVWLTLAVHLAERSTCKRLQVGTVITTPDLESVLAVGYNGNARYLPNICDTDEPGNCGCIHSEANALIKCGYRGEKTAFVTHAPCSNCAKLLINAGVTKLYFRNPYRKEDGIRLLSRAGILVYQFVTPQRFEGPLSYGDLE